MPDTQTSRTHAQTIDLQAVVNDLSDLLVRISREPSPDVTEALERGRDCEQEERARGILDSLLMNGRIAREDGVPLCQDTGLTVIFAEVGEDVRWNRGSFHSLEEALQMAAIRAAGQGYLRRSVCHPLTRENTGNNAPAQIHWRLVPGKDLRLRVIAKGGGAENMSRLAMLSPSQGEEGVVNTVVETVRLAGPNPCPPLVVGLGLGGGFDAAAVLAKKALLRLPLGAPNPQAEWASLEQRILSALQELGVGPMGLGGHTTALAVHLEAAPCHIASLPLAINLNCHAHRTGELVFHG